MIGLVVVTHGRLAEDLVQAVQTIVGPVDGLAAVSIGWNDEVDDASRTIEEAIARVRSVPQATPDRIAQFRAIFERSKLSVSWWRSDHPVQIDKLAVLRVDLDTLTAELAQRDVGVDVFKGFIGRVGVGDVIERQQQSG